jgi:hypothetical protein
MPDKVVIFDDYGQKWNIFPDDSLYEEAKQAVEQSSGKVVWPLEKITEHRGYGWWSTFKKLDEFESDLEKQIPNPGKQRLLDIDKEYLPFELRDLLQRFGSYIATLHHLEGMVEAQCLTLKEGFKTGMSVAITQLESPEATVSGRESQVLATNELFRQTKRMQIDNEAILALLKGWREAYETAWNTTSRLITLAVGEAQLQRSG